MFHRGRFPATAPRIRRSQLNSRDFLSFDGLGLAELVRNRQVSPRELVDIAVARIEQLNPSLNAVVHTMFDAARQQADRGAGNGMFAGVPMLLKDLLSWYAGERITSGSRLYRDFRAPEDTEVVKRYLTVAHECAEAAVAAVSLPQPAQ